MKFSSINMTVHLPKSHFFLGIISETRTFLTLSRRRRRLRLRHSSYKTLFDYTPRTNWIMSSPSSSNGGSPLSSVSSEDSTLINHLALLSLDGSNEDAEELAATPIFTQPVFEHGSSLKASGKAEPFAQYGLLAGVIEGSNATSNDAKDMAKDPRLFFNTTAPSSVFICGSQGSGKSHTLSCLLENCLTHTKANVLPHPLTGIVFHYDPWVSASGGSPCEAAYLASAEDISVRVLCAPTNIRDIKVRKDVRLHGLIFTAVSKCSFSSRAFIPSCPMSLWKSSGSTNPISTQSE